MSDAPRRIRCAIYTRKSSEEGLEQEFNSLDAQREACEAYIASQRHEGWLTMREGYDDGGYSGGNLDRPGLQNLLEDIRDGRVDVIVVYKIDRLSRSLMDFAKLVEVFDEHKVTFVSVTQSFNTTTSMGRLTLNVLLSFAQFEREVTGERIRDKIAASRAKGMWMGGFVPWGYDAVDRKLVINEAEAAQIRYIFERFVELGSATRLTRELARAIEAARELRPDINENEVIAALSGFGELWQTLFPAEQARIARLLIQRVTVHDNSLDVDLCTKGLGPIIHDMLASQKAA